MKAPLLQRLFPFSVVFPLLLLSLWAACSKEKPQKPPKPAAQVELPSLPAEAAAESPPPRTYSEWLTQMAEKGEAYAQLKLGEAYEKGEGLPPNEKEALKWYTKAAEQGEAHAQYKLYKIYENSHVIPQDAQKAKAWLLKALETFTQAAQEGDAEAAFNLGHIYYWNSRQLEDEGQKKQKAWHLKATQGYAKAAQAGDSQSQHMLGRMYAGAEGVDKNLKKAREWLEKSAKQGNAEAQYKLAQIYCRHDDDFQPDVEKFEALCGLAPPWYMKAAQWYTKAAEAGDERAQIRLSDMYYQGLGVPQDIKEALRRYKQTKNPSHGDIGFMHYQLEDYKNAIEYFIKFKGEPESQLRRSYEAERETDHEKALKKYTQAAKAGDAEALNNLGYMYSKGLGVPKDDAKALEFYKKAAAKEDFYAPFNLGLIYLKGLGVPKDSQKAAQWFSQAVEQPGQREAAHWLGLMRWKGEGLEQDDAEAAKWLAYASNGGEPDVIYELNSLEQQDSQERSALQSNQRTAQWFSKMAEQGEAHAAFKLGEMYLKGKGVVHHPSKGCDMLRTFAEQEGPSHAIQQEAVRLRERFCN